MISEKEIVTYIQELHGKKVCTEQTKQRQRLFGAGVNVSLVCIFCFFLG